MSKCVNKRGLGKFGAIYLIKVFVTVKTCSSFCNYVSSTSLDIALVALEVSSSERRRVVLLIVSKFLLEVSKFLLAALFANARRVHVSKFRFENTAILRLRPRKLIFLLFSKIKASLREQLTSDYLST